MNTFDTRIFVNGRITSTAVIVACLFIVSQIHYWICWYRGYRRVNRASGKLPAGVWLYIYGNKKGLKYKVLKAK
jgi:hypothetical protein